MPRPTRPRSIRILDEEWAALHRIAAALGCSGPDGQPSVSRLIGEIGAGALSVVRIRESGPASRAERIRSAIAARPGATNREIADETGDDLLYVLQVRRRMGAPRPAEPSAGRPEGEIDA